MKKNRFRVFAIETILIFVYCLLSIGLYFWFLIEASDDEINRLTIIFTLLFVFLPLVLCIWSFCTKWPIIELTEKGIQKSLFNKRLVSIDWDKVEGIKKIRSSWALWVFISTSKMENNSMRKLKKRKEIIYFLETEETKKIFLDNIPQEIRQIYDQTFINQAEL